MIIKNGNDFRKAMGIIKKQTGHKIRLINQKLLLDTFYTVVYARPVDTGFLRHNWDVEINQEPPSEVLTNTDPDKIYDEPKPPNSSSVKPDGSWWLYNNTEYATYVENGTERMQAQPMVKIGEQFLLDEAQKLCNALSKEKIE